MGEQFACASCGAALAPSARFCRSCGAAVDATEDSWPETHEEDEPGRDGEPESVGPGDEARDSEPTAETVVHAAVGAPREEAFGDEPDGKEEGTGAGAPIAQASGGERDRSRGSWRLALVVAFCALLGASAAVGTYLVANSATKAQAVTLEPVDFTTPDQFVGDLDADVRAARRAAQQARDPQQTFAAIGDPRAGGGAGGGADGGTMTALAGRSASGSAPGLYGGSRDTQVCEVRKLTRFLTDPKNAEIAGAWASTLGLSVDEIRGYIRSLTAARLSFDTRVTNHGYENGVATPVQSLLQAGTAVLIDRSGVPRVKCNCGNPLLDPVSLEEGSDEALDVEDVASNADQAWDGLDPAEAVTVSAADQAQDTMTLVDLDNPDGMLERPVGSDGSSETDTGTGDVKVTLEWDSDADLDLHVIEPGGTELDYTNKGPSPTGGQLDVDANVGCEQNGSLENVFWPLGEAPTGDYVVKVYGFTVDDCGESGSYRLTIQVAGQEPQVHEGYVGEDEEQVYEFSSESGSGSCGTVTFTPNSDDAAVQIRAFGIPCGEARSLIEGSNGGPIEGYDCDAEDDPTIGTHYRCYSEGTVIRWHRT